jgi:rubredoxin
MGEGLSKWLCTGCGYIYDPAAGDKKGGIPRGIRFEDLPADWHCPDCGAPKDMFVEQGAPG